MDELERLQAEAAAIDAETAPTLPAPAETGAQEAAAPACNSITEAHALITTVVAIATPAFPWLPKLYTEEQISTLAGAWGPVMDHYGITAGEFLSHPLAQAAIVTLPVAVQTVQGIKLQRQVEKAEQGKGQGDSQQPAAAAPVPPPGVIQGDTHVAGTAG